MTYWSLRSSLSMCPFAFDDIKTPPHPSHPPPHNSTTTLRYKKLCDLLWLIDQTYCVLWQGYFLFVIVSNKIKKKKLWRSSLGIAHGKINDWGSHAKIRCFWLPRLSTINSIKVNAWNKKWSWFSLLCLIGHCIGMTFCMLLNCWAFLTLLSYCYMQENLPSKW